MSSQFYFAPFNNALPWSQHDVVYGISTAGGTVSSPYLYATQDLPVGSPNPTGVFTFNLASYNRAEDVTTITFTQTGSLIPYVAAGSIIRIQGVSANTSVEFTGMAIGGGSGWASYMNPGWTQGAALVAGTVQMTNPGWTTGFYWVPTYTSKVQTDNKTLSVQLGDGYQQRSPNGLNSFSQTPAFIYRNIPRRQARAMVNFVEDKAGATAFEVLMPDAFLSNQPNQKFTAAGISVDPVSWQRYDVAVQLARVFDL